MLHKIRLETKTGKTHVFLDDREVHGCIKANFDYDINCIPVVKLTLHAFDVEVDADMADIHAEPRTAGGSANEQNKLP